MQVRDRVPERRSRHVQEFRRVPVGGKKFIRGWVYWKKPSSRSAPSNVLVEGEEKQELVKRQRGKCLGPLGVGSGRPPRGGGIQNRLERVEMELGSLMEPLHYFVNGDLMDRTSAGTDR